MTVNMAAAVTPVFPYRMLHLLNFKVQQQQLQKKLLVVLALLIRRRKKCRRQRRRWWVKPWIRRRVLFGQYHTMMMEINRECLGDFVNYMRMQPAMFYELLQRITPRIRKSTRYRKPLEPGLKLAITLRYLASGNSYKSLQYSFRVAHNTISLFIPEVCQALIDEDEVFAFPTNADEWKEVAQKYGERWNFHHTCGALDGKHTAIRSPRHSGTLYYNYKGFFSIILLGLVDADYKFIWADVGAQGASSDAQIFNHGPLRNTLESGTLGLPDSEPLPHDDRPIPYFLVGDDALPLRTWMMKPFSHCAMTNEERMFNYRLSRARRVVENSFGILAYRWRCMLGTMQQEPHRAKIIVMAAICLHNLMRLRYSGLQNSDLDREDDAGNNIPGAWRNDRVLQDMDRVGRRNVANREGKRLREYLKHYYNSDVGRLSWQEHMI